MSYTPCFRGHYLHYTHGDVHGIVSSAATAADIDRRAQNRIDRIEQVSHSLSHTHRHVNNQTYPRSHGKDMKLACMQLHVQSIGHENISCYSAIYVGMQNPYVDRVTWTDILINSYCLRNKCMGAAYNA